MSVAIRLIRSK